MSLRSNRPRKHRAFLGLGLTAVGIGVLACSSKPAEKEAAGELAQAAEALATTSCQALDVAVKKDSSTAGATTYAIKTNGEVWGWGANQAPFFPLGHSTADAQSPLGPQVKSPASLGVTGATQLAAGHDGACALLADHTVKCWGRMLGDVQGDPSQGGERPRTITVLSPEDWTTEVPLTDVRAITYGDFHACAIKNDTTAWCWGDDRFGQLGSDDGAISNAMTRTAVRMDGMAAVSQIAAAGSTTCVLRTLPSGIGEIDCLGDNTLGKLGNGSEDGSPTSHPTPTPVAVPAGTNFVSLTGGGHGTFCATTAKVGAAQSTYCWGANASGAAVVANTNHATSPTLISGDVGALFAQADQDGCEVDATGAVSCWGAYTSGQIPGAGDGGAAILAKTPIAVSNAFRVSMGETHGCALTGTSLSCWGSDKDGELGNGTTADTAGITKVFLSVPQTTCGAGNVGDRCGTLTDACGSTDCGACGPLNKCDATSTCVDDPTVCPGGCAAGLVCSQHACVAPCGIQTPDIEVTLPGSGSYQLSSPTTYGANACGAYLVRVPNANAFKTRKEDLFVGSLERIADQGTCQSTRVTIQYFKDKLQLGSTVTASGQWNNVNGTYYCRFGDLGSNGIWTPMPIIAWGDLRIAAKVERSAPTGNKGGLTWSMIPLSVIFGSLSHP